MQIHSKLTGTKGLVAVYDEALRLRDMITQEAQERMKILAFWKKHGDVATKEAYGASRPTLFRWQKALDDGDGKMESLVPKSTAPHEKRKRMIPKSVEDLILKERTMEKVGKEKLAVLIREDKIAELSASTVGRMLDDLKKQGKLKDPKKLSYYARSERFVEKKSRQYKPKLRSKGHQGSLAKADTIVRFTNGIKRYVLTGIDLETEFAFAYGYISHASKTAADFMATFKAVAPISLTHVQTDNGSEFKDHFELYLKKEGIVHFHIYPRTPKMNAEIERFNRTLSEAFISKNRHLLAYDLPAFNKALMEWLLWYNTRRPHWSIGLISPMRYIVKNLTVKESHMCWTSTASFPDIGERRPEVRAQTYRRNLEVLCNRTTPLEYRTARELYPGEYKPEDPRGNRLVCVSDDWLKFIERPFPGRFPAFFVNQGGKSPVAVYDHQPSGRLYAFLPLLTADEGSLARQSSDGETNWWFNRRAEFKPLSLFKKSWPELGTGIMIPLDYDSNPHQPERMKIMNVGSHAQFNRDTIAPSRTSKGTSEFAELRRRLKHRRSHEFKPKSLEKPLRHQGRIERLLRSGLRVGTVLIKEFRNGSQQAWKIQFALGYANQVPLETQTMGVHYDEDMHVYWHIHGTNIHGSIDYSAQIQKALANQAELEKDQRRSRSTANRTFSHENRAWVRDVARRTVQIAKQHGCSRAREVIKYVPQKHSGDSALNRRFSMWCFSDLGAADDHECNKQAVFSVEVSDYDAKFTCPSCGAIRKAGQTPENATTYIHKDGTFVCRACGFSEAVRPEIFAANCASVGFRKIAERIRRIQERRDKDQGET
jgi:putative transposase